MASSLPSIASSSIVTQKAYSPVTAQLFDSDRFSFNTQHERQVNFCVINNRESQYLKHDVYLSATSNDRPKLTFELFLDRNRQDESDTVLFKGSLRTLISSEKNVVMQTVEIRKISDGKNANQDDFGVFPVDGDGKSAPKALYCLFKSTIEVTVPEGLRILRIKDHDSIFGAAQNHSSAISLLPRASSRVNSRQISTV